MGIVKNLLLVFLVGYVCVVALAYVLQRQLLYFPERLYLTPQQANADPRLQELKVQTEDGLALTGWYAPAKDKSFTLVFFHGNGENLRNIAGIATPFLDAGYGFLLAEYRSYSGMPGKPSETGLYADARAFIKKLEADGVAPGNLIVFGFSLGTGVATQMATEFPAAGLLLAAPYTSVAKVAQQHYWFLPAEFLAVDRYESFKKIPNIKMPLLIFHGGQDRIIPDSEGRALFALAVEPKQFHAMPQNGHLDLFNAEFYAATLNWLSALAPPRGASN